MIADQFAGKLVKVVRHGRYVTFQLVNVAAPRGLSKTILSLIDDQRPRPAPVQAEEFDAKVKTTGEVRLDDEKNDRITFQYGKPPKTGQQMAAARL